MLHRATLRIVGVFLVAVQCALAAPATTLPIKHVYVVGDSLSDQGNLFFATGALGAPIGLPAIPDAAHYWMGRFSNGENYAGQLAQKLGVALAPSQFGGTNFAFGGARIDYNRVENRPNAPPWQPQGPYPATGEYPWSIDAQRAAFAEHARHGRADPTGLYVVFAGSNDLSDAFVAAALFGQDPTPIVDNAVEGVIDVVLEFERAGARTVLVPLVPDLGRVPSVTRFGPDAIALARGLSLQMNAKLRAALSAIEGPNIVVFDTFAFMADVFSRPGDFGFANVTAPCYTGFVDPPAGPVSVCPNPDEYFFWDVEHPTTRLHSILAEQLFETYLECEGRGKGRFTAHCAVNRH